MEAQDIYTIREIIILIILTAIGTGAFLGFAFISKKMQLNFAKVLVVFVVNFFVVCLLVEGLRLSDFFKYHYIAALAGSYMGMYFLKWLDKRSFNLFDSMIKKAGLDIETGINETEIKNPD
jgi:hypothetical protein